MTRSAPRIVLAVTADESLSLMRGFPNFLVEKGWDVHIVSAPGDKLAKLGAQRGITVHPIAMRREPSPFRDLAALLRWVVLLLRIRPDIISVGTPKAGLLGTVAGRATRVPARIYMLRGLRLETAAGFTRAVLTMMERVAMRAAHRVLCVSSSLLDEVVRLGLMRRDRGVVLGRGSSNGVDVARFDSSNFPAADITRLRTQLGLSPDVPVVGYVGRIHIDKGIDVLADARGILAGAGVDHQLLIVGAPDDREALAPLEKLRQMGRRPAEAGDVEDVRIYYRLMDVLCLPTLREGFPNVVLEAAASSVPAVTTDATGAVDSVVDGVTGLVSSAGSSADLAHKLQLILEDRVLRQEMGRQAHAFVSEHYDRVGVWLRTEYFLRQQLPSASSSGAADPMRPG